MWFGCDEDEHQVTHMYYFNWLVLLLLCLVSGALVDTLIGHPAGPIHIVTSIPVAFLLWYLWLRYFDERPQQTEKSDPHPNVRTHASEISCYESDSKFCNAADEDYLKEVMKHVDKLLGQTTRSFKSSDEEIYDDQCHQSLNNSIFDKEDLILALEVAKDLRLPPEQFASFYTLMVSLSKLRKLQSQIRSIGLERDRLLIREYSLVSATCLSRVKSQSSRFASFEGQLLTARKRKSE